MARREVGKLSQVVTLFLSIFALYRLSSLVSHDEGPYIGWPQSYLQTGIFEAIRIKLGAVPTNRDSDTGKYKTNLARGITCPLCTSAYLGIFILILSIKPTRIGNWVLIYLGTWGAQVFLENLTSDDALQSAIEDVAESLED